jgi:WD40 repeat protein
LASCALLYACTSTLPTGLFTYEQFIISSSTDKSVKVWKAVPGREQLVYPWYSLHATPVTLTAWVRSMSYDRSREVGDLGSFFAADDDGGVVRIVPLPVLDIEDRQVIMCTMHRRTYPPTQLRPESREVRSLSVCSEGVVLVLVCRAGLIRTLSLPFKGHRAARACRARAACSMAVWGPYRTLSQSFMIEVRDVILRLLI